MRGCFEQVDEFLQTLAPSSSAPAVTGHSLETGSGFAKVDAGSSSMTSGSTKGELEKAGTPTDVRDVHF